MDAETRAALNAITDHLAKLSRIVEAQAHMLERLAVADYDRREWDTWHREAVDVAHAAQAMAREVAERRRGEAE